MYFVDREKIEETLGFLDKQISLFEEVEEWDSKIKKAALERITHTIIEAILDVGNAMIDGFIMRDPGSYEDIVDILEDEKVISPSLNNSCKQIFKYRKMLVQGYTDINHEQIQAVLNEHLANLKQFPISVRDYLRNELGPVSAFIN